MQIKVTLKLEIKWGWGEGYKLYSPQVAGRAQGIKRLGEGQVRPIPALHLCRAQKKGAAFLAITAALGSKPGSSPMIAG